MVYNLVQDLNLSYREPKFAEAVEYTDCISAEWYDSTDECLKYDTKQSDAEARVMLYFMEYRLPYFIETAYRSTLAGSSIT